MGHSRRIAPLTGSPHVRFAPIASEGPRRSEMTRGLRGGL